MTAPRLLTTGGVAFLATSGVLRPVRVVGATDGRFRVRHLDATETDVAAARVFWVGATRADDDTTLTQLWQTMQQRAADADLDAAWASIGERAHPIGADELARAALGADTPLDQDAAIVAVFAAPIGFRVRKKNLQRVDAATLEAARARRAERDAAAERLTIATAELRARLAGAAPSADPTVVEAAQHYVDALVDLASTGQEAASRRVAAEILTALERDPQKPFPLLVELGVFTPDENLAVRRAGVRIDFPAPVLAEAAQQLGADAPTRLTDMRGLLTVAIDDPATSEVDDAVALDGDRLVVLISDTARFVKPGGAIEAEAVLRGSTIYLPDREIRMLPASICEDAASLMAGVERTALAFSFEVSGDGRLVGMEITRAVCRVDRQLSYEEADAAIAGDDADPAINALVQRASLLMDRHRDRRSRNGAVFFQRNEVMLNVGPDGRVRARHGNPYAPGRQLVSELMIATCAAAAEFCADQQIPCIYRGQAAPEGPVHTERDGRVAGAADQVALLRRLKPSVMTTSPSLHFTLAVAAYTQLTSPLRRYHDLVMHQQLVTWLRTGQPLYSRGELAVRFDAMEKQLSVVKRVEQESRRYWSLKYLQQHIGERFEGQVVRQLSRRWLVELDALAYQVPVKLSRRVVPGERIALVVDSADPRAGRISMTQV